VLTRIGLRRPPAPRCAAAGRFDISGVTLINPGRSRDASQTIAIADGAIASISPSAASPPPSEHAGCFALPGLIDMHVHLPPDNALKLTQGAALHYLLHGVTTVREAGDIDGTAVDAARRLDRHGVHPVPRVFSCGPFVGAGQAAFRNTILLPDASEAAAEAAALRVKATGASFMKFYDGLSEPMIRALERACAGHGLKIMGHVPAALAYEEARIAEVQHFFGVPLPATLERNALANRSCDWHAVDEARMDDIVEKSLKFGIANTPTIVTNQKMLCYRDYDAARRQPELHSIPPFYLDVVWHPERGRLNNRLARDYLERQVAPALENCSMPGQNSISAPTSPSRSWSPARACRRKWRCSLAPELASNRSGNLRRKAQANGSASMGLAGCKPARRPTSCCSGTIRLRASIICRASKPSSPRAGSIVSVIYARHCEPAAPISRRP
jgi:hypothetical protein